MCKHVFSYPMEIKENYNPDGVTLTGKCCFCGVEQRALGYRGIEPKIEGVERDLNLDKRFDNHRKLW